MSIDILVEVMDHAPASLTAAERYALLVLAEDARLPSREIKHDITDEYLLSRLRMSARSWLNMRGELVKKKAIEKVEGGHNGKRARYRIAVFSEAMKSHPIGDPTDDDAPELSTEFGDPTSVKGHPIGESRVTESVTHTYIPRITPGGTTPTTKAADPSDTGHGGGGGLIDQDKNLRDDDARRLIAALPATHQPGRSGAGKLTGAVAELLALDWPERVLLDKLGGELPANVGNLTGLLIARLPGAAPYTAPQSSARPAGALPPWCGRCGTSNGTAAALNPNLRYVREGDERVPCPRCHPDTAPSQPTARQSATARAIAQAEAAGEAAKRVIAAARTGGHQPYQNPVDQSVYLEGIR